MKRIAITQRVEVWGEIGERRDALSQEWMALAEACGFLPILIPNRLGLVKTILEATPVDGILLTGGNDLVPYGGDAPERDQAERFLIAYAVDQKLPLLGVCRGMQLLMDYYGTPLQRVEGHVRVVHPLRSGGSVNSYHAWGATECRSPLTAQAVCIDGVVEAVGHTVYGNLHGIMWHPERCHPFRPEDVTLIRSVFGL